MVLPCAAINTKIRLSIIGSIKSANMCDLNRSIGDKLAFFRVVTSLIRNDVKSGHFLKSGVSMEALERAIEDLQVS